MAPHPYPEVISIHETFGKLSGIDIRLKICVTEKCCRSRSSRSVYQCNVGGQWDVSWSIEGADVTLQDVWADNAPGRAALRSDGCPHANSYRHTSIICTIQKTVKKPSLWCVICRIRSTNLRAENAKGVSGLVRSGLRMGCLVRFAHGED